MQAQDPYRMLRLFLLSKKIVTITFISAYIFLGLSVFVLIKNSAFLSGSFFVLLCTILFIQPQKPPQTFNARIPQRMKTSMPLFRLDSLIAKTVVGTSISAMLLVSLSLVQTFVKIYSS